MTVGPIAAKYRTSLVIAKEPVAGRVKTRLAAAVGHRHAAALAAAAIRDTFAAVSGLGQHRRVLARDGDSGEWIPSGWQSFQQCSGDLDRRLAHAFGRVGRHGAALLIGMDTPQLSPEHLALFDPARFDACLGPCTDGGYWAIGLADPSRAADVIHDVPMSTDHTYREQLRRLLDAGLRVQTLPLQIDVDTITDARAVAATAPKTEFARTLQAIAAETA